MKTLRRYLNDEKFRQIVSGIFTSKLIYCISVWTGVWGIPGQQHEANKIAISKDDMNKLQILQNKIMRLMTNSDRYTPTSELLRKTRSLSEHQLGDFHTLVQVFKTYQTGEPVYHFERLFLTQECHSDHISTRSHENLQTRIEFGLSLGRSSFFYQGANLWTALPVSVNPKNSPLGPQKVKKKPKIKSKLNVRIERNGQNESYSTP